MKIKDNAMIRDLVDENLFAKPLSDSDKMKLIWGNWNYREKEEVNGDDKATTEAGARGLLFKG